MRDAAHPPVVLQQTSSRLHLSSSCDVVRPVISTRCFVCSEPAVLRVLYTRLLTCVCVCVCECTSCSFQHWGHRDTTETMQHFRLQVFTYPLFGGRSQSEMGRVPTLQGGKGETKLLWRKSRTFLFHINTAFSSMTPWRWALCLRHYALIYCQCQFTKYNFIGMKLSTESEESITVKLVLSLTSNHCNVDC